MAPYSILIIDDEETQFNRYRDVLAPYTDLRLTHVKNGPDAIKEMNATAPALIFLDQVFYTQNVGNISKMYGVDENGGGIEEHSETTDPQDILTDEKKQGLYILKKIRLFNANTPIIFVTQYVDREGTAINEALENGAQDYISKERITREGLTPRIEKCLSIKLSTLEEQIGNILNQHIENVPEDEKAAFINNLKKEALPRRRRQLPFIEAVIKKMPRNSPTSADLFRAIKDTNNAEEWAVEQVDRQEILRWVLNKLHTKGLSLHENEVEPFGSNALRYTFRFKSGNEYSFLKIIRPNFSLPDVVSKDESTSGMLPVSCYYSFKLDETDPEWEGSNVVAYIEKVPNANVLTIEEYASTRSPLSAGKIHAVLKNLADILKNLPEGHGMLDMDSIYVQEDGSILLGDFYLWDYVTEEGHSKIEGLTSHERIKCDIQALGRVADTLLTGHAGGLETMSNSEGFFDFMKQCKEGVWDINKEIPQPPVNARFIHCGPFASDLERKFFYKLKKAVLAKGTEAFIFLNARIQLKPGIPNDADALVVFRNKIIWIDVKGLKYFTGAPAKLPLRATDLTSLLSKSGIYFPIETYIVMDPSEHLTAVNSLNETEKKFVLNFEGFINNELFLKPKIKSPKTDDFEKVYAALDKAILPATESIYEETNEFKNHYGSVTSKKDGKWCDELETARFYIRRYHLGHASDGYHDYEGIRLLIEKARNEKLHYESMLSPFLLLPAFLIAIGEDSRQVSLDSASIRWLYKIYQKPDRSSGPFTLQDYMSKLNEAGKPRLISHYLSAISSLIQKGVLVDLNIDDLKVFKNGEELYGIMELRKGSHVIQPIDVINILKVFEPCEKIKKYLDEIKGINPVNLSTNLNNMVREIQGESEKIDLHEDIKSLTREVKQLVQAAKSSPEIVHQSQSTQSPTNKALSEKPVGYQSTGEIVALKYRMKVTSDRFKNCTLPVAIERISEFKKGVELFVKIGNSDKNGRLLGQLCSKEEGGEPAIVCEPPFLDNGNVKTNKKTFFFKSSKVAGFTTGTLIVGQLVKVELEEANGSLEVKKIMPV